MSIIVCNKYISCPYLYISSSYKESEAEEIKLRDDVEWAEPNMYAPIHYSDI